VPFGSGGRRLPRLETPIVVAPATMGDHTMENRLCRRKPFTIQVRLYRHGRYLGSFPSINAGRCGVFLRTGGRLWLRKGESLELAIRSRRGVLRYSGVVAHQAAGGLGIQLDSSSFYGIVAPPLRAAEPLA
jgi:hypothetical protein